MNIAPEWASLAILRGQSLIFFRSRGADAEGTLADLVHQTAMYYEDRLQGRGFARVLLCGASIVGSRQLVDVEELRRSLEDRLSTAVDTVDSTRTVVLSDRLVASPALPDTLAPLVGLLVRGRSGYAA